MHLFFGTHFKTLFNSFDDENFYSWNLRRFNIRHHERISLVRIGDLCTNIRLMCFIRSYLILFLLRIELSNDMSAIQQTNRISSILISKYSFVVEGRWYELACLIFVLYTLKMWLSSALVEYTQIDLTLFIRFWKTTYKNGCWKGALKMTYTLIH